MEYAYAALLLTETDEELNERNLRAVLEAANCTVSESRVKALVAALEGVDVDSVGPDDVGGMDDDEPPEVSDEPDVDETDDEQGAERPSQVSDEAPEGATAEPAGGDATSGDSGDESG
jgi:large subunit ribosomal protein L12